MELKRRLERPEVWLRHRVVEVGLDLFHAPYNVLGLVALYTGKGENALIISVKFRLPLSVERTLVSRSASAGPVSKYEYEKKSKRYHGGIAQGLYDGKI